MIEEIARGGMGVVWKARHVPLGRLVALKLIRDSQLASPKARERFQVEAEAAGKLHHPNIVPIYEFGTAKGQPFISMPLVEGSDLVRKFQGKPMDPQPLARLMAKLAHAIHFAHQRGILHLDLKPANVLVDAHGEPHVTDFGLAKQLGQKEGSAIASELIGSPNYMAPEQISGRAEETTTAIDVYSLGAIMYELLTGRAPFRSESPLVTLRKVQEEEPVPPRSLYKFTDSELETICLKCMEKSPERRYTSARALAADLERWLNHEPIQARPITVTQRVTKWMSRNPGITALLVLVHVVLALGLAGIIWMGARAATRADESQDRLLRMYVTRGNQHLDAHEDFTALLWFVQALRLEKQGPVREENHRYRIDAVLRRASMLQQAIFHEAGFRDADFDPDGRRLLIGTAAATDLIWDVATGQVLSPDLKLPASVHRVRFSPDGKKALAMDVKGNARVWDAASGAPLTPFFRGRDYNEDLFDWSVRKLGPSAWFSPDGSTVLTAWGCKSAHLWDAASGEHLRAFSHDELVVGARFSPDGKYVVTGSKDNYARVWDVRTGQPLAKPLPHDKFVAWAEFSPDASRLVTVSDRRTVHLWDWRKGRELISPLSHGDVLFQATFSPDGHQIMTAGWDKTARIWDAATGLGVGRFSVPGGIDSAAWCPDGKSIATASEDGAARIWDATGTAKLLSALPHGSANFRLAFSADGKRLVTFGFAGMARVWDISQPAKPALEVNHPHSVWAEFNSDATRLVTAGAGPESEARVFDALTGSPVGPLLHHTNSVRRARFSLDGTRVVTASDDFTARIWDASSGQELIPPLPHPGGVLDSAFSPDGRIIATACDDGAGRLWESATGRLLATLEHSKKVTSIVFSPAGRFVATASDDFTARIWDVTSGEPLSQPLVHVGGVNSVRFNRDSTRLLSGCDSQSNRKGEAQIWDVRSGRPTGKPIEHEDDVIDAEFSPDERFIVTASQDRTARVWDARTRQPVTPSLWHLDSLLEAVFTPDGHRVVTLTAAGDVRLWDVTTGEAITTSLAHVHGFDLGHLNFSPDGKRLLIAAGGAGPIIRDFKPCEQAISVLVDQAEMLTGHRLDSSAGIVRLDAATLSRKWQRLSSDEHRRILAK